MLLNALIICISIQFVMAYHFGLAQVQRDSAYKWIERSVILSFTSNILIVTALIQSGMQYYLNTRRDFTCGLLAQLPLSTLCTLHIVIGLNINYW